MNQETLPTTKEEFVKTKEIVRGVLMTRPETRNDDKLLLYEVICSKRPTLRAILSFAEFKSFIIVNMETVRRCRQAIQHKEPILRPTSQKVKDNRQSREFDIVELSREGVL
jgi:hypothetical protein